LIEELADHEDSGERLVPQSHEDRGCRKKKIARRSIVRSGAFTASIHLPPRERGKLHAQRAGTPAWSDGCVGA
jgi:hypothetical protein